MNLAYELVDLVIHENKFFEYKVKILGNKWVIWVDFPPHCNSLVLFDLQIYHENTKPWYMTVWPLVSLHLFLFVLHVRVFSYHSKSFRRLVFWTQTCLPVKRNLTWVTVNQSTCTCSSCHTSALWKIYVPVSYLYNSPERTKQVVLVCVA